MNRSNLVHIANNLSCCASALKRDVGLTISAALCRHHSHGNRRRAKNRFKVRGHDNLKRISDSIEIK